MACLVEVVVATDMGIVGEGDGWGEEDWEGGKCEWEEVED